MERETFLKLATPEIAHLVQNQGYPRLGVFVPDGSRRLVMALTDAEPGTEEFYRLCATFPAQYLLSSLQVFFDHGLDILLVPILSRSVLNRGGDYQAFTALIGLELLFHSSTWLDFYDAYDIRVRVYGDPDRLDTTAAAPARPWIREVCAQTASHQKHTLYFAIGESPYLAEDVAEQGIRFYQQYGRIPTRAEQIQQYYGAVLPPADFFIMTSKFSGMGALPRFLVSGDTEIYFSPGAGSLGINARTYREILFDLLFERSGLRQGTAPMAPQDRRALRTFYEKNADQVIGLGHRIGSVWVPDLAACG
ncbi:MAG: hypothetical protein WCF84_27255 [Anaerolineae bacterium]